MEIRNRVSVTLKVAALLCWIPMASAAEKRAEWREAQRRAPVVQPCSKSNNGACADTPANASSPGTAQCELAAWVRKGAPPNLPVRSGPGPTYSTVATIPRPYTDGEEIYFPQVTITGSRDGWFRISEVITDLYGGWPTDPVATFTGEGWLPGNMLRVSLESPFLLSRPSKDAPVAFSVSTSSSTTDDFQLDTLHACEGPWVEVEGRRGNERPRGWIRDICASQVTTCP